MKILVSGATGMVGTALSRAARSAGHEVISLSRRPGDQSTIVWDPGKGILPTEPLNGIDAVIHLAGDNVGEGRWTEAKKARIRESRTVGTALLARTLAHLPQRPSVLVSASAIGYYGDQGDKALDEAAHPGALFLSQVCREWEQATQMASASGIRVVNARIGVILATEGGALPKMLTPFRMGVGGVVGSGQQYWSWVALDDVVGALLHAMTTTTVVGPMNVVAPDAVTNREFTRTLGRVLRRPTILPMPAFAARLALGQMADELLLASARVVPKKLLETQYTFRHPHLEEALRAILAMAR